MENIHKFNQYIHFLSITKNDLSWLNNLFIVNFQLIRMLSYAKNKHQMCWVTQHQCRSRQMWKIFTNSPRALTFVCYKKWPVLTEQSIHGKFQLTSMSSYAKNKQQMCRVTQHQCNVAECGKYSQIHPVHWLFVYYKKKLSWLNNLFMVMFQLIRMSSYAKNKLQCVESLNISVEVAKCGKYSQIHQVHSLFVCNTKWPVLSQQSIHGKLSTH